jgi:plastocyanin
MHFKGPNRGGGVIAGTLLLLLSLPALTAEVPVAVLRADGGPLQGAVVTLEPASPAARSRAAAVPATAPPAVMDQRDLAFVPETLVVRTGASVDFPNSDKVRHQVYSFSGAKTFKLALYAGRAHPPVVFDKPGLVTVGCNIHDGMIGYIVVTDTPWSGRTDAKGAVQIAAVPEGSYTLRIWHPRIADGPEQLSRPLEIGTGRAPVTTVNLTRKLKPAQHNHGTNQKWEDY